MTVWLQDADVTLHLGDVLDVLRGMPAESVDCVVTSPPYWSLRDYGVPGQLGLEETPEQYVDALVAVFAEVRRVLAPHGTVWCNLGDSYTSIGRSARKESPGVGATQEMRRVEREVVWAPRDEGDPNAHFRWTLPGGQKPKDLVGIPWRVAFALQQDGWWLRSAITWCKPNAMPESVTDRPTKSTEMVFLLTKAPRYYYDAEAIRRPHQHDGRAVTQEVGREGSLQHRDGERWPGSGANERDWWMIATQPFSDWGETVRRVRVAADADVDGKKRTASPDCPTHGDPGLRESTADDGERGDAASSRNGDTDGHDPAQQAGLVPTVPLLEPSSSPDSSDSPGLLHGDAASLRSSRTHKTAHAAATTEPCTPSAETADRTGHTSASPESSELGHGTSESRTSPNGWADRPSAGTPAHSDCTCEWYVEHTEKTSHFATFPMELVRRCLLAGCPSRVCRVCGKASERLIENSYSTTSTNPNSHSGGAGPVHRPMPGGQESRLPKLFKSVETLGWSDCGHNDWRPGRVLDPFVGSGTSCKVARDHGRHSVGIDLNADYLELAARRLQQQSLFSEPALSPTKEAV